MDEQRERELRQQGGNAKIDPRVYEKDRILSVTDTQQARLHAKALIDDRIRRLNQRLNDLHILKGLLPTQLTPEQDEALWNIISSTRESF